MGWGGTHHGGRPGAGGQSHSPHYHFPPHAGRDPLRDHTPGVTQGSWQVRGQITPEEEEEEEEVEEEEGGVEAEGE